MPETKDGIIYAGKKNEVILVGEASNFPQHFTWL